MSSAGLVANIPTFSSGMINRTFRKMILELREVAMIPTDISTSFGQNYTNFIVPHPNLFLMKISNSGGTGIIASQSICLTALFLLSSSCLVAQSAPPLDPQEIISEDDLKLGLFAVPRARSSTPKFTARQQEGKAKDGELQFLIITESNTPSRNHVDHPVAGNQLARDTAINPSDTQGVVSHLPEVQQASIGKRVDPQ